MTPSRYLIAWGAWLAALAIMLAIWSPGGATPLLQVGGALPALAGALYVWLRPGEPYAPRLVSDSSVGTVVVAIGISVALLGATAGLWLALVGAEILALGIALLIRELRGMRRQRRAGPGTGAEDG